jgi:hypothetical protein
MTSGVSFGSSGVSRVSMLVARLSVYTISTAYFHVVWNIHCTTHVANGLNTFEANVSSSQVDRVLYGSPVSPHSDMRDMLYANGYH